MKRKHAEVIRECWDSIRECEDDDISTEMLMERTCHEAAIRLRRGIDNGDVGEALFITQEKGAQS